MQTVFEFEGEKNHFILTKKASRSFRQSVYAGEQTYEVSLKHPNAKIGLHQHLLAHLLVLFEVLMEQIQKDYGNEGYVRVFIRHRELGHQFIVKPQPIRDMTGEHIMEVLTRMIYSAKFVPCDQGLEINVAAVKFLKGKGRLPFHNWHEGRQKKKSVLTIQNVDNICLARAIVVGKARLHKDLAEANASYPPDLVTQVVKKYNSIRRQKSRQQKIEAIALLRSVGLPSNHIGSLKDIPLFEQELGLGIVVLSTDIPTQPAYPGSPRFDQKIVLLHTKPDPQSEIGHFDVVTSVTGWMCRNYVCMKCFKSYQTRGSHQCDDTCAVCGYHLCKRFASNISCNVCNRLCRSKQCLERHKKGYTGKSGRSIQPLCGQSWQCPICRIRIFQTHESRAVKNHACGERKCHVCQESFLDRHLCHMRILKPRPKLDKFIFFDFECIQETGIHVPNMVVMQTSCSKCGDATVSESTSCTNCGYRCEKCGVRTRGSKEFKHQPCANNICGKRRHVWSGVNTRDQFGKWLLTPQNKDAKVFAHNARSYDSYFVLAYMKDHGLKPDKCIMNGSKIMYMRIGGYLKIDFLDSLNFLPMALSKLPKSFGLTELKKGFFPFLFNTSENQHAVFEHLPHVSFYDPDSMYPEKRKEFLHWYEANKNTTFDFHQEMLDYCVSDVTILQEACMKFRALVIGETSTPVIETGRVVQREGVDPFTFITIPSVCLGIYKAKFLPEWFWFLTEREADVQCSHGYLCKCTWVAGRKLSADHPFEQEIAPGVWEELDENSIALSRFRFSPIATIPSDEYGVRTNHSQASLEWLAYEQQGLTERLGAGAKIQHARNGGEKKVLYRSENGISSYYLDGFFEYDGRKHALEFYGCAWHGCPKCFPLNRHKHTGRGKSLAQLYTETLLREERLKSLGFLVSSVWQCEFESLKQQRVDLRQMIQDKPVKRPLRLRDAYFGGRTNATVLYKKVEEGEKAHYFDFTSLYPDVLKYQRYPVGHPVKLFKPEWSLKETKCSAGVDCGLREFCSGTHLTLPFFGLVLVTVLPPKNLLYPVLPVKIGVKSHESKLMFPLCLKCALNKSQQRCVCSAKERQFTGTYCTPELEYAINCGYQIIEIQEVLHWSETSQYDPTTKEGGLFTDYINTFLKLKQESSGYPPEVKTQDDKDRYVHDYFVHEGIWLNQEKIENNPGLRSLAKLALNSFYGKFGQRHDMKKTDFCTELSDVMKLFTDNGITIQDFHLVSESVLQVTYTPLIDFEKQSANSNVVIATFCTSYSRLKLLGVMNSLLGRVLYHDTDSIIFTAKQNEWVPLTGQYLGELTDELSCKNLGCSRIDCTGHFINEFVSCGPKNYSYTLNTGEVVCKVRGFSLNHSNSKIINFHSMKEALFAWLNKSPLPLVTIKTEIRRDSKTVEIVSKQVEKHYGVVYDKRVVQSDYSTIPYGYVVV